MKFKPNHICKNSNCPYGKDGKPKEYYACNACDRTGYRRIACSRECYTVVLERLNPSELSVPNRTDKTSNEVDSLMSKPLDTVIAETKQELSMYAEEIEAMGLEAVIDLINEDIDKNVE